MATTGVNKDSARRHDQMARVGSVSNAPWFHLKAQNLCHGYLENVYQRPDERSKTGTSKFFQIELLEPCEVREGRGKEAKVRVAKAGTIVNLNYGPKTKELEQFVSVILRGGQVEVSCFIEGEKFAIGKGQTMWPMDVRAEMTRPPQVKAEEDVDFGDDDDEAAPAAG